jgi:hypothetical protein
MPGSTHTPTPGRRSFPQLAPGRSSMLREMRNVPESRSTSPQRRRQFGAPGAGQRRQHDRGGQDRIANFRRLNEEEYPGRRGWDDGRGAYRRWAGLSATSAGIHFHLTAWVSAPDITT